MTGDDPGTPSNGVSANGAAAHPGSDPPTQVQATSAAEAQTGFFDREADTNEFAIPGVAPRRDEPEPDDFRPEGIVVSGPAAPPEEVTADAPATAPPERRQEPKKRVTKHEWQVDDGSEDDSGAFVPANEPTAPEPRDAERDGAPATEQVKTPPAEPPAPAGAPVPPADTDERIRAAELAGAQAAEQQAVEEINALEEDLERAKREGEARVEELEAKLRDAEAQASVAPDAAHALEEQARTGAANWLREQVRQIERSADQRVKAAAKDGGDRKKLAAEYEQRLAAEIARVEKEADERMREAADERVRDREKELERQAAELEDARAERERAVHEARAEAEADRDEQVAEARRELDSVLADRAKALADAEGAMQSVRTAVEEAEAKARAAYDARLKKELDRVGAEADARIKREVAAATATTETEAREALRSREEALVRERAAVEGELAATRRQLDESHERAAATEIAPPDWVMEAPAQPAVEPEPEQEQESPEPDPAPRPEPDPAPEPEAESASASGGALSLSSASFDELRATGMSVTQAKRVIRHRDEHDGFSTVDELEQVPGFPKAFLADVKSRVVP